jgi:hypothetical protein
MNLTELTLKYFLLLHNKYLLFKLLSKRKEKYSNLMMKKFLLSPVALLILP